MGLRAFKNALLRRKHIDSDDRSTKLERCLTTFDLTALGIGSTLGLGIYVLAGQVASEKAGPAVCISFFFAAVASMFAGICYAEFGARVNKAGSAYSYSYITVGEFIGFIIGWNLVLEYVIGTASVARGYSEYLDSLFNQTIQRQMNEWFPMKVSFLSAYPDALAFAITILLTVMLAIGVRESTRFNSLFTGVNLMVVLFVVIYGSQNINFDNWNLPKEEVKGHGNGGFAPYGIAGIMAGAATCFYGFIGFDIVATTAEEAKNPQKSIPIAITSSLVIVFLAYFGVSSIQTLMWPYYDQSQPAPLPYVFDKAGLHIAKIVITVGAIAGLTTSLLGALYPLPRILYAMAEDGLIFRFLADVSPRYKTPLKATVIAGLFAGLMAALFNIQELADMMSIGTLLAYTLVSVSVLILRFSKDAASNLMESPREVTDLLTLENELNKINNNNNEKPKLNQPSLNDELEFNFQNIFNQILNLNGCQMPNQFTSLFSVYLVTFICFTIIILDIILAFNLEELIAGQCEPIIALIVTLSILFFATFSLSLQPRNSKPISFQVPLVPFVPLFSVLINVYLMMNLSVATWIRFGFWMFFGLGIYFFYGISESNERYRNRPLQLPILISDKQQMIK